MKSVTNREVQQMRQTGKQPASKGYWWLLFALWLGGAAWVYLHHPYLQTLSGLPKLLFSLFSFSLWLTWLVAAPLWQRVVAGAMPLQPEAFTVLYAGASLLVLAAPWLLYQWWLSMPAAARRVNEYRAEKHRQEQRQLTTEETRRLFLLKGGGLPLASLDPTPERRGEERIGLSLSQLEGHALVIGPTRSGKGMHLTETLLCYPGAMVVIDPKGEQYERTAGYREGLGPVYRLPHHTVNLADYYDLGNRDDVAELHYHLMKPWADREPVFADKCKSLFTASHAFAVRHGLNPIRVLFDLADSDPAVALAALATVDSDAVMAFTNGRSPDALDRMAASAWGTFATRMYEYQSHVQTITNQGGETAVPLDWAEQNATVYITYAFHQLKGVGGVVSAVIAALMRHQVKHNQHTPAIVAVDELPAVGLRNVTEYLATVGGYKLTLLLYAQTYAQLVELYGERGAETVLSNCQHQVWYPPGNDRTADKMEATYGTTLQPTLSLSRSLSKERLEMDLGKRENSISEHLQKVPALEASKMTALDKNEVIVRIDRQYIVRAYRLWPVPRLAGLLPLSYTIRRTAVSRQKVNWRVYGHGETADENQETGESRKRPFSV